MSVSGPLFITLIKWSFPLEFLTVLKSEGLYNLLTKVIRQSESETGNCRV